MPACLDVIILNSVTSGFVYLFTVTDWLVGFLRNRLCRIRVDVVRLLVVRFLIRVFCLCMNFRFEAPPSVVQKAEKTDSMRSHTPINVSPIFQRQTAISKSTRTTL